MSTTTSTKAELLAKIEQERDAWDSLLAEVGEDRMLEDNAVGSWRFKDLIAHLEVWDDHVISVLEAELQGKDDPAPAWPADLQGDDPINQWIEDTNRDVLVGELIARSREIYARLAALVEMTPDDAINDPARFPYLEGKSLATAVNGFFEHYHDDHEKDVRQWIKTRAAAPSGNTDITL